MLHRTKHRGKYLHIPSVPITFAPPQFEPEPLGKLPDDANHYAIQLPYSLIKIIRQNEANTPYVHSVGAPTVCG